MIFPLLRLQTARRRATLAMVFVALVLLPRVGAAQDFSTKVAARKLGEEGIVLFEKKQYAEALEKFNLAEQIVPAPTLGLRAARCLVQLGRFVEASERYLEVTRIEMPRSQLTQAFRKAQADALLEREDLLPLIPTLTIEITGPTDATTAVYIDGEQIPTALLGQKRPIDPGVHEVEVRRKDTKVAKKIDVVVKQNPKLRLELPPLPAAKGPEVDPKLRTLAWIGIGVGAAGAVSFAVTGSLAVAKQRELVTDCPNRQCLPAFHNAADTYNILRYATTAGIIVGVVGFGVGIPLLIAKPTLKPKKDALIPTWTPVLGPAVVGVRGTF
jgi:tetratricopeptide (TPR) repeat protein